MNIEEIADQLEHTGYIVLDQPFPDLLLTRLLTRCQDDIPARFHAAHIGRGAAKVQIDSIRGDVISWLDDTDSIDQSYLAQMEILRMGLNRALFLGLFDYECHYAIYDTGAGYAKHSDVLLGKKNRILTTVLYLNEDWQAGDGGELNLFEPTGTGVIATLAPKFGTMIIFLSESFPHEVLISHHTRRSLTGWFRVSGS
ncbi:MAG: 2OG-Fe(II) oxygenase [Gallionella sp.]|nr:2OG-Fe(II) oxygenase [Gallionella sp.]